MPFRLPPTLERHRYLVLTLGLASQFVLLGLEPGGLRSTLMTATFLYILGACTLVVTESRRFHGLFLAFAIFVLLSSLTDAFHRAGVLVTGFKTMVQLLAVILTFLFMGATGVLILRDVMFHEEANSDKVWGAIAVYLLLGLVFAQIYSLVDIVTPGSFDLGTASAESPSPTWGLWQPRFSTFCYFSYVTLTTLGYGDVSPVAQLPRMLATLEAVSGQIFLCVLVARLVAQHMVVRRATGGTSDRREAPPEA